MKILGLIGTAIAGVAAVMAGYLHFVVAENSAIADRKIDALADMFGGEAYRSSEYADLLDEKYFKTDFGTYVLLVGGVAVLLSLWPAIKKVKIAWIGVLLGLAAFFVGAAYGTHMFS